MSNPPTTPPPQVVVNINNYHLLNLLCFTKKSFNAIIPDATPPPPPSPSTTPHVVNQLTTTATNDGSSSAENTNQQDHQQALSQGGPAGSPHSNIENTNAKPPGSGAAGGTNNYSLSGTGATFNIEDAIRFGIQQFFEKEEDLIAKTNQVLEEVLKDFKPKVVEYTEGALKAYAAATEKLKQILEIQSKVLESPEEVKHALHKGQCAWELLCRLREVIENGKACKYTSDNPLLINADEECFWAEKDLIYAKSKMQFYDKRGPSVDTFVPPSNRVVLSPTFECCPPKKGVEMVPKVEEEVVAEQEPEPEVEAEPEFDAFTPPPQKSLLLFPELEGQCQSQGIMEEQVSEELKSQVSVETLTEVTGSDPNKSTKKRGILGGYGSCIRKMMRFESFM